MSDPVPESIDLAGQTLGDFDVLRKIGTGGMGQVYLARQRSLKREVALKLLRNDLAGDDTALKRFQAEAEAIARLSHPNIVQVYAIGEQDGLRYMVLEYVQGRNLRDYLARRGPPELPVALAILKQIAAALHKAGELGIVHRDIKPENILLTRKAEVKVADFGLSRLMAGAGQTLNLTQSGVTLGTPMYMAPEQVQGQPTDHRSDLYSFGVTAFHLLAGQPPFSGGTAYEVAMKHCTEDPPALHELRPDLPPALVAVVQKLMAKNPAERYASAREVLRDLSAIQKGLPTNLPPPSITISQPAVPTNGAARMRGGPRPIQPSPSQPQPNRWPRRILGMVGLAALVGIGWWLGSQRSRTSTPVPPTLAGLPDPQLPRAFAPVSLRERELRKKMENRQTPAAEMIAARLELGLLHIRQRQFDAARRVFDELEQDKLDPRGTLPRPLANTPPNLLAARFAQAVLLAHEDNPEASIAAFLAANNLGQRGAAQLLLQQLLLDHPDFAEAIADALQRNQDNLPGKKLPAALEWLRSPAAILRGREPSEKE